ncbi:protein prune homolog 2 isoform X2 [Anthonomus grandis grandis]|uniref:protein prune homolog 2 isoform X2 n=1 Tax=Anthonomus grandis grandis TaxID=2921223 RepID=UPI002165814D|nr:protein prune homolog 2 isoform X2 [Anthonomus grandis grandis]
MEQCSKYDSSGCMNSDLETSSSTGDQSNQEYSESKYTVVNKSLPLIENATNFHPLMTISPVMGMSPDFPDLIPEKAKNKYKEVKFNPEAHSTTLEHSSDSNDSFERQLNMPILEYDDKLPEFPKSPSALKKLLMYDLPVEGSYDPTSDTENDKSIYEAHLSSNLQRVSLTMNEKEGNLNFLAHNKRSNKLRRIRLVQADFQKSDVSSLDSDSDDSLKSDIFEDEGEKVKDLDEDTNSSEPIEPLSAAKERRHARNWQRMILPGGEHRTIDMRVIEPYKRVLSHGGYLRAGGHTAIVLFAACHLPDKSRVDYDYVMDNLFLYVLWTLERLVTEDYVMVYLHGAATRLPSFSWLKRCYQMIGRKLRKNLSHLYIVHPTLWIKTMLYMSKPFIRIFVYFQFQILQKNLIYKQYKRLIIESSFGSCCNTR